jgi:hypothetical protein
MTIVREFNLTGPCTRLTAWKRKSPTSIATSMNDHGLRNIKRIAKLKAHVEPCQIF